MEILHLRSTARRARESQLQEYGQRVMPARIPSVRGTPGGPDIYEVEGVRVLLERHPSMTEVGRQALHGSVLMRDGNLGHYEGAQAQLYIRNQLLLDCPLTPFGTFAFEALGSGDYRLLLIIESRLIWLEPVSVR